MKQGIIGVLNNPASGMNSHSAGWNMLVRDLVCPGADFLTEKDTWHDCDELFVMHGPNFKPGTYNIIGGIGKEVLERVGKFNTFNGPITVLDGFEIDNFLNKRGLSQYAKSFRYEKRRGINYWSVKENMVIGDSHSISVWPGPTHGIDRRDGKTLWGFLKEPPNLSAYKDIILYFGNIDIRFHLMRQPKPLQAARELMVKYIQYAIKYNATLVHLLPVEHESRKLPGTGLYKGKPFYGSMKERQNLVNYCNNLMSNYGKVLTWPDYFLAEDGSLSFEVMEPRQSVHLRPKYYKRYDVNDIL